MAYTTINKGSSYFNTLTYTGTSSAPNAKTGVGFQPDLVWIKPRTFADPHRLHSPLLTGSDYYLQSNATNAEAQSVNSITSFDSDGFTLGNTDGGWNSSSYTYVAWNWLAGNGTSSNTDGDISSTVSVNNTSGFSIVKYTGNGITGQTIGHGLNSVPKVILNKALISQDWLVHHKDIAISTCLKLNTTDAPLTSSAWNSTAPTSSVFTIGSSASTNASGVDYINYCFAEVKGFSKFGSYTGNGSTDGTFVYTGFKPAFVIIKRTDTLGYNWVMVDNKRSAYNLVQAELYPSSSTIEDTAAPFADFVSNGFKMRTTSNSKNASGGTYIYMAFAEHPLVSSSGVPCTAR